MDNKITNRIGFSFPWHIVFSGAIASLAGIGAAFENPILGLGLFTVGVFLLSSSYGTQIDFGNKKYREYGTLFFIKRGPWKELDKLQDVTVLTSRTATQIMANMVQTRTVRDERFEVCLLNNNHRRKIAIQKFKELDDAKKFATSLAAKMNSSVVKYSPVVSDKTRSRR